MSRDDDNFERRMWSDWFRGGRRPIFRGRRLRGGGETPADESGPGFVYVGHTAKSVLKKIESEE